MDLVKTTAKGLAWTTVSAVVRSVVSLLQVSILTRFLPKGDFGLIAIATLFITFTQIFMDMGLSAGIMHRSDTTPHQYSSLFWLNIFAGAALTGILCLIAPLAARIYHEPQLTPVLMLLSLSILFTSMGSQHRIIQQKKMRFRFIAIVEIVTALLSLAIAVILAVNGAGVYSLVFSNVFHAFAMGVMFLVAGLVRDRNISFHFRLSETYDYLKIGVYQMGSQILDFFSRESDILIISATLGKETVGVYSLCKKLVLSVYNAVSPVVNRVFTPLLATIQEDKERLKKVYLDSTQTLSIFNMPVYCLIAVFSVGILNCLYGAQYIEGSVVLILLSLTYGITASGTIVGSLQTASGRTDLGFYWTIFRVALTMLAVYLGSLSGINTIAAALLAIAILNNPVFWNLTVNPIIGGTYGGYFSRTILIGLAVAAFSLPFWLIFGKMTSVPACLGIGVAYALIYFALLFLLFPNLPAVRLAKERLGLKR